MSSAHERIAAFVFGIVFLVSIMVLAVLLANPTPWQYQVFRVVLALAAAGVAAMLPGSLEFNLPNSIKAGGALAVFALLMYKSPAALVATPMELMGPLEFNVNRNLMDFGPVGILVESPQECSRLCSANQACKAMTFVKRPDYDKFGEGDCWLKEGVPPKSYNPGMISAVKASEIGH